MEDVASVSHCNFLLSSHANVKPNALDSPYNDKAMISERPQGLVRTLPTGQQTYEFLRSTLRPGASSLLEPGQLNKILEKSKAFYIPIESILLEFPGTAITFFIQASYN